VSFKNVYNTKQKYKKLNLKIYLKLIIGKILP